MSEREAASRSVLHLWSQMTPRGWNNSSSDPAFSRSMWLHVGYRANAHAGQGCAPAFPRGHVGSFFFCSRATWVHLFVYHLLSFAVTPHVHLASRLRSHSQTPWLWLFWPRRPGTAALLIYMCALRPQAGDLQPCMEYFSLYKRREWGHRGVVWIFSPCVDTPQCSERTLTLAVCWQAGASIDHFAHSKQSPPCRLPYLVPHHPSQHLRASDGTPGHAGVTLGL